MSFDWNTANNPDRVSYLGLRLQAQRNKLHILEQYYDGRQPTAYVAPEIAEQLQNRLASLNANYCRVLTDTLVQRISVTGFQVNGADTVNAELWKQWQRNRMSTDTDLLVRDVMALGRGYLAVWSDKRGRPTVTVESPFQVIAYHDPVTRECLGVLKQWQHIDDVAGSQQSWSVLYLPDEILHYVSESPGAVNSIPSTGWKLSRSVPNPLGVPPVVEFVNRTNVLDAYGTSEYEPILGLQDALNKVLLDSMVHSEFSSFQRRWATGLAIQEDDNGNPISPFGQSASDVWTSENAETRFGTFDSQSMTASDTLANLITRHISAVTGLPEYLTGTGAANPVSSDAINASELTLTMKAQQKLDLLAPSFGQVGALMTSISTARPVANLDVEPVFASLQNRSQAMMTDSFTKLAAAGVPLNLAAEWALGLEPTEANRLINNGVTK